MKNALFIGLLLAFSTVASAQDLKDSLSNEAQKRDEIISPKGKNELKINLYILIRGMAELTYERIMNENITLGISGFVPYDKGTAFDFGIVPYVRLYSGPKVASGFFMEVNGGVIGLRDLYDILPNGMYRKYTKIGFGAAAGLKFLTIKGISCEAYIGASRLVGHIDENYNGSLAYPRIGMTIGKRF